MTFRPTHGDQAPLGTAPAFKVKRRGTAVWRAALGMASTLAAGAASGITGGLFVAGAVGLFAGAPGAFAQNLFAPVATVNGAVVTRFELDQRLLMTRTLSSGNGREDVVLDQLIDERLQDLAYRAVGMELLPEGLQKGMEAFASRGEIDLEAFLAMLNEAGVATETFRDFISHQMMWRDYVANLYRGKLSVSDAEVDHHLAGHAPAAGLRYLVNEIILPARTPEEKAAALAYGTELAKTTSYKVFQDAARQYSAAPSAANGGRIDWTTEADLPPVLRGGLRELKPGQVSQPFDAGNVIAMFQMVSRAEAPKATAQTVQLEYAAYYIDQTKPEAAAKELARLAATVKSCDDLYTAAAGKPAGTLERNTLSVGEIPNDVAIELAKLDQNEVSTLLTRASGQTRVYLMLCDRQKRVDEPITRDQARNYLLDQKLISLAGTVIAQMRADAVIVKK